LRQTENTALTGEKSVAAELHIYDFGPMEEPSSRTLERELKWD
jgi:hypothetical protein